MALVGASLGVEHDDPAVAVTIGREDFLGGHVDRDVGWRAEPVGRAAVWTWDRLADLQHELAVHREFQELAVGLVVAGEPDEIVVVDVDAVLAFRPIIALAWTAPVLDYIASLVEHQHRRRRHAALGLRRLL